MDLNWVQQLIIWAPPVILAVTVHEAAHGYVARACGDPTAAELGRLTLNPIRHIDPIGTVILPLTLLLLTSFVFGWAKPVPVDPRRLRSPRRDMALVAAAGPASNFAQALVWTGLLGLAWNYHLTQAAWAIPLLLMAQAGIVINLVLGILNLLPVPPLDGGRILTSLLPPVLARPYARLEPVGLLIVLALLATGLLSRWLLPLVQAAQHALQGMVGLG